MSNLPFDDKGISENRIQNLIQEGFSYSSAEKWNKIMETELNASQEVFKDLTLLHEVGFSYRRSSWLRQYNTKSICYLPSDRDIIFSLPISGALGRAVDDRLSMRYVFDQFQAFFPKYYYVILKKGLSQIPCKLMDAPDYLTNTYEDILSLLEKKKKLRIQGSRTTNNNSVLIKCLANDEYSIGRKRVDRIGLLDYLKGLKTNMLILEHIDLDKKFYSNLEYKNIHICTINNSHGEIEIADAYLSKKVNQYETDCPSIDLESGTCGSLKIPHFDEIKKNIKAIAASIPELEYANFILKLTKHGFFIDGIQTGEDLLYNPMRSDKILSFIQRKKEERLQSISKETIENNVHIYELVSEAKKESFTWFMLNSWNKDAEKDMDTSTHSIDEIKWCHEKGFLSYRIDQYGLNKENYQMFLSDRDYRWLRPLNPKYRKMIKNKITPNHMFQRFPGLMPDVYYSILKRNGQTVLLKNINCPEGYDANIESLMRLIKEKRTLAFKRLTGAHGLGFMKVEYKLGHFKVNNEQMSPKKFKNMILSLEDTYLVTEFLKNHFVISSIYSNAVSTVRVMIINEGGDNPIVADAYLRIAAKATGYTDNVAYGGIVAKVDLETGAFSNGEKIENHKYVPCPRHPDTNMPIEGVIENWNEIKSKLVEICKYLSPMEYLGLDVVLTEDGFKLLELNNHQDIHNYVSYSPFVKDYFNRKVLMKKESLRAIERCSL